MGIGPVPEGQADRATEGRPAPAWTAPSSASAAELGARLPDKGPRDLVDVALFGIEAQYADLGRFGYSACAGGACTGDVCTGGGWRNDFHAGDG